MELKLIAFEDFSSYLMGFITLEPIVFKTFELNFNLAAFLVVVYLLTSRIQNWFHIFSSDEK